MTPRSVPARRTILWVLIPIATAAAIAAIIIVVVERSPQPQVSTEARELLAMRRSAANTGWTQAGGDGAHAAGGASKPIPLPLKQIWSFEAPMLELPRTLRTRHVQRPAFGLPVVADGVVVAVAGDLFAIEGGRVLWRIRPPEDGGIFDPVILQHDTSGESVIAASLDGDGRLRLSSYRLDDGHLEWETDIAAPESRWAWTTATDEGVLVVTSPGAGELWYVDTAGTVRWHAPTAAPVSTQQAVSPIASDGRFAVIVTTDGLEAHDIRDGAMLWSGAAARSGDFWTPAIWKDLVFTAVPLGPSTGLTWYDLADGAPSDSGLPDISWFAIVRDDLFALKGGSIGRLQLPSLDLAAAQDAEATHSMPPGFELPIAGRVFFAGSPSFGAPNELGVLDLHEGVVWTQGAPRTGAPMTPVGFATDEGVIYVTDTRGRMIALGSA